MNYSREPNIRLDRRRRHGAIASLLTAAFVATLSLLVMLFVTSAPVEGQDDRSINDSISASRALVADDLYRVTAAAPLPSLTLPFDFAQVGSQDDDNSLPFISFTATTTPFRTSEENGNIYFGVEEGEIGHFAITLDRVVSHDVTINVRVEWDRDHTRISYTDPRTGRQHYWRREPAVTIPAGKLSIPFRFEPNSIEDEIYTAYRGGLLTYLSFTHNESTARLAGPIGNRLPLRWIEDDVPKLSLDFANSADDDGILKRGDSFDVVVRTSNLINNENFRIEADLRASVVGGADLDWDIPPVTINAFESESRVTVHVPDDGLADFVGKEVVLGLENATMQETARSLSFTLEVSSDVLTLNAVPKASLNIDSLVLVEGETATITVTLERAISGIVAETTETLRFETSDDYEVKPETITLAQAQMGVTLEIKAVDDADVDPDETFVLKLSSLSGDVHDELTLEIIDKSVPYALLEIDSLVLAEGERATIAIEVSEDISSVIDETLRLVASDETLKDDYRITPEKITLTQAQAGATFEIEAVDDRGYDPGESVMLLLEPSSGTIQVASKHPLVVDIDDNDPLISFTTAMPLRTGPERIDRPYFGVEEGEIGHFAITLDRVANHDVTLSVRTHPDWDRFRDVIIYPGGDKVKYTDPRTGRTHNLNQPRTVTIPAGQLSIPFMVDATGYENDEYSVFIRRGIALVSFTYYEPSAQVPYHHSNHLDLRWVEDDIPTLSLDFVNLATDDGILEEGASFGVVVDTDAEINNDRLRIEANVRAYANGVALDWGVPLVVINAGERKARLTVNVPDDSSAQFVGKDVVLRLENAIVQQIGARQLNFPLEVSSAPLTLNVAPKASLNTNSLTLVEGESATITVEVYGGDLRPVGGYTLTLVQRSGTAIEGADYGLTPMAIYVDGMTTEAVFEVKTFENDGYNPAKRVVLELTSTLDTVKLLSSKLELNIVDETRWVAFAGVGIYKEGKNAYLDVDEGDVREFAIELDRESNENVYVSVFLNDDTRVVTAEQLGDKRIPFIGLRQEPQDRGARGWSLGGDISRDYWLMIPAGTRSVTFTVNFEDIIDNRLGSLQNRDVVTLYFGIEGDSSGAITDLSSSRLTIRQVEDDTPKVSLTTNPDDPSVTVTESGRVEVVEGSSFEVWVDLAGKEINANLELEVTLTATVTPGTDVALELSTVTSSRGATVTVEVADDDRANGRRTFGLELERVVLEEKAAPWLASGYELALPLSANYTLMVDVVDDETPTVSLKPSELILYEGQTGKVIVELRGNLDSLIDTTLGFEPQFDGTASADDYTIPTIAIGDEVSGVALKTYTVEIYASHSDGLERLETVVLQLNPSVDRIDVLSTEGLRLNVVDNSPRASLSVDQPRLEEGDTAIVQIVLRGDLSSVIGETLELVHLGDEGIDYPATAEEDYTLTIKEEGYDPGDNRITIDEEMARAGHWTYTVEVLARVDGVYDPEESVRLGLKSSSARVEFVDPDELRLDIVDGEGMPTISFADDLDELTIVEGESVTLTVELDHPSGRRIALPLEFKDNNITRAEAFGYDSYDLIYPEMIVFEAGETSAQIRFDTRLLSNEIYIWDSDYRRSYNLGDFQFYYDEDDDNSDLGVLVLPDAKGVQINIRDNESRPTLLLRQGELDRGDEIEKIEGESFLVWVGFSHPYDGETRSTVELTSTSSPGPDWIMWEDVVIEGGNSGTLHEFTILSLDNAKYDPIPDVTLNLSGNVDFENGRRTRRHRLEIDKDFKELVVSIVDNDIPTAKFVGLKDYDSLVPEGDTAKIITVSLEGDRTALPETYTLELKSDPEYAVGVLEDNIEISTLRVTVSRDATEAVFNVVTINNNRYDPGNRFAFSLASSPEIVMHTGDDIIIQPVDTYISDLPEISFVNPETRESFNPSESFSSKEDFVRVLEGAATTIGVKLSNPSIYDVKVYLLLNGPGDIDPSEYDTYTIIPRSVTIPAGETYTTITYDTRVLDNDDYDIPEHLAERLVTVDGLEYRHLGNLELKDPLNEARTEPDGFVKVAAKAEGGHIPLVVIEDDEVREISFSNPETKKPFSPEHQYSFSGNTHLLRGDMDNGYLGVAKGETTMIGVTLSRPSRFTITVDLLLEDNSDRIRVKAGTRLGNIPSSKYDTYTLIPMSVTIAAGETHTTIFYNTSALKDFDDPLPSGEGLPGTIFGQARRNYRYLGDLEFSIPETQSGIVRVADWKEGGYLPLVVIDDEIEDGPPAP